MHWTKMKNIFRNPEVIAEYRVSGIVDALNKDGIVEVSDFFSEDYLQSCERWIHDEIERNGAGYFSLVGRKQMEGTPFPGLGSDPDFKRFIRSVSNQASSIQFPEEEIFQVLRVVASASGKRRSNQFHFDATLITALMPVLIPDGLAGQSGELVVYPNMRRVHRSIPLNLLQKVFFQNTLVRILFSTRLTRKLFGAKIVKLKPGSLYLFWGFRTYHSNMPCETSALRATLLLHFGDPHAGTPFSNAISAVRQWREARIVRRRTIR